MTRGDGEMRGRPPCVAHRMLVESVIMFNKVILPVFKERYLY
jgi:hypothetical protein